MQDFAGSTVVHLIGATGGFAALLLLGPRRGKYGPDGKPRAIPGHSMPLVGLGVLILWSAGSASTRARRSARSATPLRRGRARDERSAAAAGVIGALGRDYQRTKTIDVGMVGNGAIAGLVAITAPSGYVEFWAAPIIGFVAGLIVVFGVILIDKMLDDPVGALSAHGLAGIWGTLSCGLSRRRGWRSYNAFGDPRRPRLLGQLPPADRAGPRRRVAFAFVFVVCTRRSSHQGNDRPAGVREDEDAGLDIVEHGMYGYPEQFIPQSDFGPGGCPPGGAAAPAPAGVTATA